MRRRKFLRSLFYSIGISAVGLLRRGRAEASTARADDIRQGPALDSPVTPESPLPEPRFAPRFFLPISPLDRVEPGRTLKIRISSEDRILPGRLIIEGAPDDWIVNDIEIGGQSQFGGVGDIPGSMFAQNVVDAFIAFRIVKPGSDMVLFVTYVGHELSGDAFRCQMIGTLEVPGPVTLGQVFAAARRAQISAHFIEASEIK